MSGPVDPLAAVITAGTRALSAGGGRVLDVRVGAFWTVVHTSLGTGLASTLRGEAHLTGATPVSGAGTLLHRTPAELLGLLRSPSLLEASVGLATANALLGCPEGRVTPENAAEILLREGRGRRVVMVGRFPFVGRVEEAAGSLAVHDRGMGGTGRLSGPELAGDLAGADVVALTASTLVNGTLGGILEQIPAGAFLMMLGPSTPMAPELFDLGFHVLCGTVVEDPQAVLRAVSEGAVTSQIPGVRRVCLWR